MDVTGSHSWSSVQRREWRVSLEIREGSLGGSKSVVLIESDKPFPSYFVLLFQKKSSFKAFRVKMKLIYIKMILYVQ